MINLKNTYIYATALILIGTIVYAIWFNHLLIWFLISACVGLLNYALLERISKYKTLSHVNVLLTLFIRYIVFVAALLTIIMINRNSPDLIHIGISTVIGISIIQVATIINALIEQRKV